jgi:hypothetical protein
MLATGGIRRKHFLNVIYFLLNIYNTRAGFLFPFLNFSKNLPNFKIWTPSNCEYILQNLDPSTFIFGMAIAPLKLKI